MAINGEVELTWGDGEHKFNIAKIGQVLELEDKCNCGVSEVYNRIREGRWRFNDLHETIRLGLIGAGMEPPKAMVLVRRYVDDRPWVESVQVALLILMSALVGVSGDEVVKKQKAEQTNEKVRSSETVAESSVPQSTVLPPHLGGPLDKQMN